MRRSGRLLMWGGLAAVIWLAGCTPPPSGDPSGLVLSVECPAAFEAGRSGTLAITLDNPTGEAVEGALRVRVANYLTSASTGQVICEELLRVPPQASLSYDCFVPGEAIEGSSLIHVAALSENTRLRAACTAP